MLVVLAWIVGIIVVSLFVFWAIVVTEGVFFGRTLVIFLYDISAFRYDKVKEYTVEDETLLVVEPVLMLARTTAPHILDVATGTGRVPYFLLNDIRFEGQVTGIDLSRKMLDLAKENVERLSATQQARITLTQQAAYPLPYPEAAFDGVTCLETLEFLPSDQQALEAMVAVLKPGGFLITTRRTGWEAKAFLWRYRSADNIKQLFSDLGLEQIFVLPWQSNYDLVIGRKPRE